LLSNVLIPIRGAVIESGGVVGGIFWEGLGRVDYTVFDC
jgi:hypothetical protein